VTSHAGETWTVTWFINFPQYGPVDYYGMPNPVISWDGKKKWSNPSANGLTTRTIRRAVLRVAQIPPATPVAAVVAPSAQAATTSTSTSRCLTMEGSRGMCGGRAGPPSASEYHNASERKQHMKRFANAACCAFLLLAGSTAAAGQQNSTPATPRRPTRVPVTVVLTDTSASQPAYSIVRRSEDAPYDLIVLTGPADAVTLSDAVSDLLLVRSVQGDTAAKSGTVRLRQNTLRGASATRTPRFPWAERVVTDVRLAEARPIPGFGNARAVVIWLPPQHGRPAPPGHDPAR
jgi:hypothetical protein